MHSEKLKVTLQDIGVFTVERGSSLHELCKPLQERFADPIVAAIVNNKQLRGLHYVFYSDCDIELVTLHSKLGLRMYQVTIGFLLNKAVYDLFPGKKLQIKYTVSNGVYCEITQLEVTPDILLQIDEYVKQLVQKDIPLKREYMNVREAVEIFANQNQIDKMELLHYRMKDMVHLFSLEGYYEYTYREMLNRTGLIRNYRLIPSSPGFIYQTPEDDSEEPIPYVEQKKLSATYQESEAWAEMLQIHTIPAVNRLIEQRKLNDLIAVSEALHEKQIAKIADMIAARPETRVVLIAGPSSAGKTTFTQRLIIQLRVNGKRASALSLDNYFVDRDKTPLGEDGKHDFEALEALQLDLFNQHLQKLIEGQEVKMPLYDFLEGKTIPERIPLQLPEGELLLIEGIHGLNDELTWSIPPQQKFKIYVSALTQLNLDHTNRISTTDLRLIRRIVRDYRTRGHNVWESLQRWPSVQQGAEKYIFRYQENADGFFNSSLLYELAVLKPMVEPLLKGCRQDQKELLEVSRLLKILSFISSAYDANIPHNSILREFIGGSWFQV